MPMYLQRIQAPMMQQSSKIPEQNKETAMIETLWEICQVLSTAPLSAQEVAQRLGKILQNPDGNAPIIIQPNNVSFKEAMIVREMDTNEPASVEFTLSKPGELSLSALRDRFGNYSITPKIHFNSPIKVLFYVDITGSPYTCAIIAQIQPGDQELDDGLLTAVTIRRDIRLPE